MKLYNFLFEDFSAGDPDNIASEIQETLAEGFDLPAEDIVVQAENLIFYKVTVVSPHKTHYDLNIVFHNDDKEAIIVSYPATNSSVSLAPNAKIFYPKPDGSPALPVADFYNELETNENLMLSYLELFFEEGSRAVSELIYNNLDISYEDRGKIESEIARSLGYPTIVGFKYAKSRSDTDDKIFVGLDESINEVVLGKELETGTTHRVTVALPETIKSLVFYGDWDRAKKEIALFVRSDSDVIKLISSIK